MSKLFAFVIGTLTFFVCVFLFTVGAVFLTIVEAFVGSGYYDSSGSGRIDTDTYHKAGALATLISFWFSLWMALYNTN
jgi:hypothetical protein